jgi:hypothetical protein
MTGTRRSIGVTTVVSPIAAVGALLTIRSTSDELQSRPEAAPAPARVLTSVGRAERDLDRRLMRTVDGVRFSYSLSTWSRGGDDWTGLPIVNLKGRLLFFEAETTRQADRALKQEVVQIVESIRFHE